MQDVVQDRAKNGVAEPDTALRRARAQSERAYDFRINFCKPNVVTEALQSAGFSDIWAQEEKHPIRVANVGAFLAMAEASPLIHAELAVLAPEVR